MLILVIDSCGSSCGVCVWQDGRVLAQAQEQMERGQDARLMPMIVAALAGANVAFSDLDRIAVTRGPGSFTGVRVGLAAARGIGIASGKPVIGIDRFGIYHALHKEKAEKSDLLVALQSKRVELFCQYFPAVGETHETCMMTQPEIDTFIASHPDTDIAGDMVSLGDDTLSACAKLAAAADPKNPAFLPRPLYLRAPDVTFPAAKSR